MIHAVHAIAVTPANPRTQGARNVMTATTPGAIGERRASRMIAARMPRLQTWRANSG